MDSGSQFWNNRMAIQKYCVPQQLFRRQRHQRRARARGGNEQVPQYARQASFDADKIRLSIQHHASLPSSSRPSLAADLDAELSPGRGREEESRVQEEALELRKTEGGRMEVEGGPVEGPRTGVLVQAPDQVWAAPTSPSQRPPPISLSPSSEVRCKLGVRGRAAADAGVGA
eukprot:722562-Rhodomonas_salina.3